MESTEQHTAGRIATRLASFAPHWSNDNWKSEQDTKLTQDAHSIDYADLTDAVTSPGFCIRLTFLWAEGNRSEEQDYEVAVRWGSSEESEVLKEHDFSRAVEGTT